MTVIALLGAGIFAKEEHLPAIEAADALTLGAVYSRSQKSAEALAASATLGTDGKTPDVYFDSPATAGRSLDDLLARSDIQAIVISLPILVQPAVITKALAAGKHVLSEKPIAKDVAAAKELIQSHKGSPIWAVAENFRFLEVVNYAADQLRKIGGAVTSFNMQLFTLIGDDDKFFNTEWRKVPEYQGGFLLDGGVHFVAGLRHMLAAVDGQDLARVSAATTLLQPKLAPVDTVQAVLTTTKGVIGSFSVSFGIEHKGAFQIEVVTTKGIVTLTPTDVTSKWLEGTEKKENKKEFSFSSGVKPEVAAFAASIPSGKVDPRQSPQEALKDLAALEAMLTSADKGGQPVTLE
ncbi:hypothetical protein SEUCBS139899_004280 [Sporothrix eucalyptigena]|uniref:Uncharacterized protein n=1 Tax=Sporothrix eucalyptigena TaxID=1812306 RepID=A0ABP0BU18_9PEZI